jgi:hypothetical protein
LVITLREPAMCHCWVIYDGRVSYEEPSAAGRRPDLTITRNSVSYTVELTRLGLDREFRAIERYCDELKGRLQQLERQHEVELVCRSAEVLSEKDLAVWLAEIGQACERTAVDGQTRTVARNGSETSTFPAGQRPAGRVFTGPVVTGDVWRRVATRIGEKAEQTTGRAAWLRIDDTGALLRFTDRSAQPLHSLLADLQLNVAAALADSPHVRGLILSGGTMIDPGNALDETAWEQAGPTTLITPGPPRHALADGPAAISVRYPADATGSPSSCLTRSRI